MQQLKRAVVLVAILGLGMAAGLVVAGRLSITGPSDATPVPPQSIPGAVRPAVGGPLPDLSSVADGTVACIYSLNVLEHIEDDTAIVRELRRKLKPGGKLLIYVPAFQVLYSSMDRKVGHFRRYRLGPLCALLKSAQFEVQDARYVDSLGFLATLVFKLIDKGSGEINVGMLKLYDRAVFPLSRLLDLLLGRVGGKNLFVVATRT